MTDPEKISPPSASTTAQRRSARPKYQVFISSTFMDLEDARRKVTWELLKAGHIPVGMENFSANDERGWRTIQRTIDTSDYYVLIIGGRYGTIDDTIGMSWTEREYRYARERGVPVLAFIRDPAHVTMDKTDRGEAAKRLEEFVKAVKSSHLCEKWTTEEDLCSRVAQAVRKAIDDAEIDGKPRPGWYRGDQLPLLTTSTPAEPHPHDVRLLGDVRAALSPGLQQFLVQHNFGNSFHVSILSPLHDMAENWVGAARRFHDPQVQEAFQRLMTAIARLVELVNVRIFPNERNMKIGSPRTDRDQGEGWTQTTLAGVRAMNDAAKALALEIERFEQVARDRIRI